MERIRWAVVADVPWAGPCPGHQVPANASLKARVTPLRVEAIRKLVPVGSARRRVIQTSTGAVQLPVGRDVGKGLLLTKIKDEKKISSETYRSSKGLRGDCGGEDKQLP